MLPSIPPFAQTPAELAADVTPVNYQYLPGDLARYGFSSAASGAVNSQAVEDGLASNGACYFYGSGTHDIDDPITFITDFQSLTLTSACILRYAGTDCVVKFSGISYCQLDGFPLIQTTNSAGNGVVFEATSSAHCRYNISTAMSISGKGGPSTAAYAASGTTGVKFGRVVSVYSCYFNHHFGGRISGYNTNVLYDAPGGSPANGPSGCAVHDVTHDDTWFGHRIECAEVFIYGGFFNSSAGTGANDTTYIHLSNGAVFLVAMGVAGEPGAFSRPYNIGSGCANNTIIGNFANFGLPGIDSGSTNRIETGRESFSPNYIAKRITPTWGAAITIDTSIGSIFDVIATTAIASAVGAPVSANAGFRITIKIKNASGGALGTTWNAVYKLSAWTDPANGFSRSIDFVYDGTNWVQVSQTGVNVPN